MMPCDLWSCVLSVAFLFSFYTGNLGGDPGSNYLEHCGGYAWALTEGLFGIDLFSDAEAAATIRSPLTRMDSSWGTVYQAVRARLVAFVILAFSCATQLSFILWMAHSNSRFPMRSCPRTLYVLVVVRARYASAFPLKRCLLWAPAFNGVEP